MGSSPLARGLPQAGHPVGDRRGIIPARAGFTSRILVRRRRMKDHPRSRGVYEVTHFMMLPAAGSSPLARGLPRQPRQHPPRVRIIPARAGFTPPRRGWRREWWDHPRSRGVYRARMTVLRRFQGSSPLARGLRGHEPGRRRPRRIIPARAGFTPRRRSRGCASTDHPRSRGVYVTWSAMA